MRKNFWGSEIFWGKRKRIKLLQIASVITCAAFRIQRINERNCLNCLIDTNEWNIMYEWMYYFLSGDFLFVYAISVAPFRFMVMYNSWTHLLVNSSSSYITFDVFGACVCVCMCVCVFKVMCNTHCSKGFLLANHRAKFLISKSNKISEPTNFIIIIMLSHTYCWHTLFV